MISCEEATLICNKTQYKESSLLERIQLRLHVLVCKTCGKYTKMNTQLTELCTRAELHSLTEAEKQALKERIAHSSGIKDVQAPDDSQP